MSDLKRLATKTELPSGDRDTGRQRNEHCAKNAFQIVFFMVKAIPHNSKCRYGERGAAAAKPKAPIILDTAKVSAASGGYSEPKQGQRSQSARGFCPRSTMRVPQPDIIEHFGHADAVPHTEPQRGASERNRRLRRLLARRSAGAVLKPSGGNCAVLPKVLSVMCGILPVMFSVRNHHRRNHQSQSRLNQSHQNQGVNS